MISRNQGDAKLRQIVLNYDGNGNHTKTQRKRRGGRVSAKIPPAILIGGKSPEWPSLHTHTHSTNPTVHVAPPPQDHHM